MTVSKIISPANFFSLEGLDFFEDLFKDQEKVWDILRVLPKFLSAKGKGNQIKKGVELDPYIHLDNSSGPIWIGQGTKILPFTRIRGPAIIGRNCQVGGEIKHAVILDGAHSDHSSNYIGDSIVGRNCRLGCGTVLSNRRFDRKEISVRIGEETLATGLDRFGAILGDGVKTGCGSVLGPGALISPRTWIAQGVIISNTWIGPDLLVQVELHRMLRKKPE